MGLSLRGRFGKLSAWGRLAPWLGPPAFLSPGAVCWARAYSGEEGQGRQPASRTYRRETGSRRSLPPRLFLALSSLGWVAGAGGRDGVYQVAGGLPKGQELARIAWLETYPGKEGGRRPTGPTDSHTGEPRADDWSAPWYMALPLSPPRRVRREWAGQVDPGPLGS